MISEDGYFELVFLESINAEAYAYVYVQLVGEGGALKKLGGLLSKWPQVIDFGKKFYKVGMAECIYFQAGANGAKVGSHAS